MIPLYDTNTRNSIPFVNYFIILSNIFVFILQLSAPNIGEFIMAHGFISARFSIANPLTWAQILSSMWMHGGYLHIIFNMWFLHIFGDNVEDSLGHIRYLLFYIVCGVIAVGAQYAVDPTSTVPLIGASGAIAGVTGAYLHLYRHSRIVALVPSFLGLWHKIALPSWIFLGYWFALQVISGVGSLASIKINDGGVAFFAHIGGFVCGYVLVMFWPTKKKSEDTEYEKLVRLYN